MDDSRSQDLAPRATTVVASPSEATASPPVAEATIATVADLRALYAAPRERSQRKELVALDAYARRIIALSPFLVLATSDGRGHHDASPRGGAPGFVKVTAEGALLVPDAPGNNRLDSLENIVAHGRAGLLFLVPGIDETLRVNGVARLSRAPADIAACTDERRAPKLVIRVAVEAVYLHCAKALMRSRLWDPATRVPRDILPSMGEMIHEQAGIAGPAETQAEMLKRYAVDL